MAWIVDIAVRPVVNPEGLKGALDARSRSKVGGEKGEEREMQLEMVCLCLDIFGLNLFFDVYYIYLSIYSFIYLYV